MPIILIIPEIPIISFVSGKMRKLENERMRKLENERMRE